jgi:hypothetical protein
MTLTQIIETVYQMKRTGRNHVKSVSEDNFAKFLSLDRLEGIGNSRLKIIGRMNIITTGILVGFCRQLLELFWIILRLLIVSSREFSISFSLVIKRLVRKKYSDCFLII